MNDAGWSKRNINVWQWVQRTKEAGAVGVLDTNADPDWLPLDKHEEERSESSDEEDIAECPGCKADDEKHGPRAIMMNKR